MKKHFAIAVKLTALSMVIFGFGYPLFVTAVAKLIAPGGGGGERTQIENRVVGFKVIGQSFVSDRYFNTRPSAVSYNAAATGGSNKSNGNPEYLKELDQRVENFLRQNPDINKSEIPVDIITASGSGLDPHISVQAAKIQIKRIARVRNIPEEQLSKLVSMHIEGPLLGFLGPSRVNVLELNLALDRIKI